jgi:hypothetical protein
VGEGTGEPVSEATERIKRSVEQEIDRAKQTSTEAKEAFQKSVEYVSGPAAENPEQAREQLGSIRSGLEHDLATLASRVPDPDELKQRAQTVAVPAGIGVAVVGTAVLLLRRRRAQRQEAETIRTQAAALARELARVQQAAADLPETPEPRSGGRAKWVLLLAGAAAGAVAYWQTRDQGDPEPTGPPVPPVAAAPVPPATVAPRAAAPPTATDATVGPAASVPPVPPATTDPAGGDGTR